MSRSAPFEPEAQSLRLTGANRIRPPSVRFEFYFLDSSMIFPCVTAFLRCFVFLLHLLISCSIIFPLCPAVSLHALFFSLCALLFSLRSIGKASHANSFSLRVCLDYFFAMSLAHWHNLNLLFSQPNHINCGFASPSSRSQPAHQRLLLQY